MIIMYPKSCCFWFEERRSLRSKFTLPDVNMEDTLTPYAGLKGGILSPLSHSPSCFMERQRRQRQPQLYYERSLCWRVIGSIDCGHEKTGHHSIPPLGKFTSSFNFESNFINSNSTIDQLKTS